MLKNFFLSEKKLLMHFKQQAQVHEKNISNEMNSFLQCRRQIFMCLSFLQKKSFRA